MAAAALAMARLLQAAAMLLQLAEDPILLAGGTSVMAIASMNRDRQCLPGVR